MAMDDIDRVLIDALRRDARASWAELGRLVGLSGPSVTERVSRLEEIEDCWFVAGDESFLVKVRVPDVAGLERTLSRLRRIRGVARTRTTVVLSTKWEGRTAPPEDGLRR